MKARPQIVKVVESVSGATSYKYVSPGIKRTAFRNKNPAKKAQRLYLFEAKPSLKIDCLPLQLKPWNKRARHKVAKAMVLAS